MEEFKINNKGTGKLFSNTFLEGLTKTNFAFPVILYFILSLVVLLYGIFIKNLNVLKILYYFPAGVIFFTLIEYLIHRFLFHFKANTEKEKKLQYVIHGVHHEFPKDKDRLVMPPLLSIFVALVFFFLFKLVLGSHVYLFYSGFLAGYSIYLLIHYAVHRYRTPKNFFKYFWKHHSLHHYKSTEGYFSVSFPFWDYLFRSIPSEKSGDKNLGNKLPDII